MIKKACSIVDCLICAAEALELGPTAWILPIHAATLNRGIVACLQSATADEWSSTGRRRRGIGFQNVFKRLENGKVAVSTIIGDVGGFCCRVDAVREFHAKTPQTWLSVSTAHVALESYVAHQRWALVPGVRLVDDFEADGALVRSSKSIFSSGEIVVEDDDRDLAKVVLDQLLEHEHSSLAALGEVDVEKLSHVVRLIRQNVDSVFALYYGNMDVLQANNFDMIFADEHVGLLRTFVHGTSAFSRMHPLFMPLVAAALVLKRLAVRGMGDAASEKKFLTSMVQHVPAMQLMAQRVPRGLRV